MKQQVYSVSSVNQYIKSLLMDDYALNHIYVRGEVSNCKYHTSGHIYFTLKDAGGAIACVMFASARKGLAFRMSEGMSVIVMGSVSVYERDGRYQLYAREIRQEGIGKLYEAYEALKKKLLSNGLFDEAHKKKLPVFPKTVGIITAKTGAALQDIINVTTRRNPYIQLVFCAAQVQGEGAAASIVRGIRAMTAYGVDVMIVGRGGGSIEDLWAFNEEAVARAVYECPIPVISAVGHETDTTIIDFAADHRAPTPSAAAELAVPDIRQVFDRLEDMEENIRYQMASVVYRQQERANHYEQLLAHLNPVYRLNDKRQHLIEIEERLYLLMKGHLSDAKGQLRVQAQQLEGVSPMKQLARGYAYLTDAKAHGITHVGQVQVGDHVMIEVLDGTIDAAVTELRTQRREEYGEGKDVRDSV